MAVIKIDKVKVTYDKNYKGLAIKCEDNTNLSVALKALVEFEKKSTANEQYLKEAMEQKNVGIHVKCFGRFMPMGYVSLKTFNDYKSL